MGRGLGGGRESDGNLVKRKRVEVAEPAQVYASYPRQGGGRTHLMPVTLWGREVQTPISQSASAWIVPMVVHTGPFGEPLSVGVVEGRSVNVETPR